jgi:hypothetical protein
MNRYDVTGLLEIFHTNPVVARNHLAADEALKSTPSFINTYTREAATQEPLALLDTIARIKQERNAIVFKIFPDHLPGHALAEVIAKSDELLIHTRNRIHSYISDVIATRLASWSHISTSDQYIDFSPDSFRHYSRHVHKFLSSALELAIDSKKAISFSSYEALMEDSARESIVHTLLTALLGSNHLGTHTADWLPTRQDTRPLASDKVTNPDTLLEFLEEQNVNALDNGAFDISFSKYSSIN